MDRMIYLSMSGAKAAMQRQEVLANNLANVSTNGFRAELAAFRAVPVQGSGASTRVYSLESTVGASFEPGAVTPTGHPLDVAMKGNAWLTVQGLDGTEAYTRAGALDVDAQGQLVTKTGLAVLGDGGPITVPPNNRVAIGADGTVSAIPTDTIPNAVNIVGRIKLVNPRPTDLERGDDGLFRLKRGLVSPPDGRVQLAVGALEGSNVSMVESLVDMIAHARQYETQVKLLQTAENNARQWSQVMNLSA
jgi:flagellar basal-body rod protein FlgF